MKVILINTYPMDEAYHLWEQGLYPGHHLWGATDLKEKDNFELIILKHEKYQFLQKLGKFLGVAFLDQQLRAMWSLIKNDAIYAPYAVANTRLILTLKLLGIIRKPVIIVVHQPLFRYTAKSSIKRYFFKKLLLQYDAVVFLSENLRNEHVKRLAIPQEEERKKFFSLNWGPEPAFYKEYSIPKNPKETTFIISAGHTKRDFDTIVKAFQRIKFPLKIYCTPDTMPTITNIPEHVEIICGEKHFPYLELLKEYNKARIILIPLSPEVRGTEGLTSLLDVLGMGKPVIMTKNTNINLDVDKEGIGISVEQGNVEGWVEAVNSLLYDYKLLEVMSTRCMQLFHHSYNLKIYSDGLYDIFKKTIKTR